MPLLDIRDLQIDFHRDSRALRVVDGVSLTIAPGEIVGLVGESGSGKSVTALAIAGLLPCPPARYAGGEIFVEGRDVLKMSGAERRSIRGGVVGYIFQEPRASLDPVFRVGSPIKEALKLHRPAAATGAEVIRSLKLVGIPAPESRVQKYPHEISGGMPQRVMIAAALAAQPKLLLADEPTTALDTTVQAQIIELLRDLRQRLGMAVLLITHNLGLAGDIADRMAVMYAGQIVETGPTLDLLERPLHPYTQALLESVPSMDAQRERLRTIPGQVPQLGAFPSGCRFYPRCSQAQPECEQTSPVLIEVEPARCVRCPFSNR
jgi:oligopeptide/dipeptide ABC transporter ATP-binding protein